MSSRMSWCCRPFSLPPRSALLTNARSRTHSLAEGIENRHLVAERNSESRLSWRFSRNRGNGVQRDSRRVPILSVAILATVALFVAG